MLRLHLHSRLNTWFQWIGQRQLQDETRIIYFSGFGASCIRDFTVSIFTEYSKEKQKQHCYNVPYHCYVIVGGPFALPADGDHTPASGALSKYAKLRVAHAPGMPGTFSLTPWVSDPDMHHGTCVAHVPWCMSGSLTNGFLWNRWREKRSQHSWRMRNPQFCVSGKRSMTTRIQIVLHCWWRISRTPRRTTAHCGK